MSELLELFRNCNYQVSTDTRKIIPGSLFIALKGDNFNGNQFAAQALEKGAKHALVDESEFLEPAMTLVDDGLKALQNLAHSYRQTFDIPVLGITGSNGKTTAKELINEVLSQKFQTHSTPGNFNNHIGLPLTILSMPPSCEFLILEMGDNHMGEIKLLSEIGAPNFGLVTNVGKDHIEGFGSFENNKLAKKELFDYLSEHDGTAFIPRFEEEVIPMSKHVKQCIYFGGTQDESYTVHTKSSPFVHYSINGESAEHPTQLIGDYNLMNVEMALAIGRHFGVDLKNVTAAISNYSPQNNRSQFIEKGGNKIFLDAYNANPSSVQLALESFDKQHLAGNRVVILGDMLELGDESVNEHQEVADIIRSSSYSGILVGNEYGKINLPANCQHFTDRHELINWLNQNPIQDTQILIKGSRGIRLEEVLDQL